MNYVVLWDGPTINDPERGAEMIVTDESELDAALGKVAEQATVNGQPYAVQVYRDGTDCGIMVGVGHPDRSFVSWVDNAAHAGSADAAAFQPGVTEPPKAISFDFFGAWTELEPLRTRVRPEMARQAAREYVNTGQRPTCVEWE